MLKVFAVKACFALAFHAIATNLMLSTLGKTKKFLQNGYITIVFHIFAISSLESVTDGHSLILKWL